VQRFTEDPGWPADDENAAESSLQTKAAANEGRGLWLLSELVILQLQILSSALLQRLSHELDSGLEACVA